MKRLLFLLSLCFVLTAKAVGVGGSGMYQWSVELRGYISNETGKAPNAYLWLPQGCSQIKAVVLAQQNMTEEAIFKSPLFQKRMARLGIGMIWVAPAFNNNWDPSTGCQNIFEEMMTALADQSGHSELTHTAIIPLGHSAQATFPWNFAAWNPNRTLCIISFHGDAPRTNLCGYGTANVEWGRQRNIDGIPGLMIEGEYEWWEARVRPALAFRMMYPESCISFLCDTGRGHFDCGEATIDYICRFIEKSVEHRLTNDGKLQKVDPTKGWLAERFHADMPGTDGADKGHPVKAITDRAQPAPYAQYQGDIHDAFWYFDREMAELTEKRYAQTRGKKVQYVGFEYNGKPIEFNEKLQGGMVLNLKSSDIVDGKIKLKAILTDSTHINIKDLTKGKEKPYIEVIDGPIRKIDNTTFQFYPYEAGTDNLRRSFSCWVVAVVNPTKTHKGAVQPLRIELPRPQK